MTIRIPDGNAFRIRLTARNLISGEYTEAADLSNIDNLVINYVRRGIRFPHAYTIDEEGRATVADAGTLDCGFYGIELTGYYGGEKFRFYGKDLFEITTDTTDVIAPSNLIDIEITVKLNASGVSKDYVDHAVNGMEASMETMQADLRDEIAEAGKVDDVKVNGVSVVSGKKANITVPTKVSDLTNDSEYQNEQQVQQKVDAAKITSANISVDGGTGTPSGSAGVSGNQLVIALHNIKGEKGDPGESIVGPQGPQGDSFQPIEDVSGLVLAHTIGQDNTKAMSQKAVTDELTVQIGTITQEQITALSMSRYIYNNTWYATSTGNNGRLVDISAYKGRMISIVSNENYGAMIAFFSTDPVNNQTVPYCVGTSYVNNLDAGQIYSAFVPNDCKYLFVRHQSGGHITTPSSVNFYAPLKEKVNEIQADNTAIHTEISSVDKKTRVDLQEYTTADINAMSVFWYIANNVWTSTNTNNYGGKIAFAEYAGKKIEIVTGANPTAVAFLKTEPAKSGSPADYCDETELITLSANTTTVFDIPSDCNLLYLLRRAGGQNRTPSKVSVFGQVTDEVKEMSTDKPSLIYLSKDGSDDNDGKSTLAPKATFAAAMNAGGKDLKIILLSDLRETLNLSSWNGRKSHLEIIGRHGAMSRIIRGTFLADLEPYEGYDDVYTWTPAEGNSIIPPSTYTSAWLWQHEIPDASTLIPANERHPLQRGRTYRRLSTRLTRVNTLEALLSANSPCWYGDYTNNVLYLRAVAGSDVTENPIVVPSANGIAIHGGNYPITLVNVEAWYGSIVTSDNFVAKDCAARYNMYEGAWEIDNCKSVYLERCEADSNTMPGTDTGDGFNLHPTHNQGDDPLAKAGTHTLVDCWSHDNRDDGYSDHGKSEGTIIGGLYEHNGKAGLVPAYGSHDTIYNATCQKNSRGITCLGGQTQDGGNGTQVACYGCVCTDNYYNFSSQGLQGQQVRFILNNCISRNAINTAIFAKDYAEVVVRDCTDSGSPTVKSITNGAVITIDNGTVVS